MIYYNYIKGVFYCVSAAHRTAVGTKSQWYEESGES